MLYRLVSIYYSPEYTAYVLQWRETEAHPWCTLPTVRSNDLPLEERRELREAFGG